jgi:hypothetical protein
MPTTDMIVAEGRLLDHYHERVDLWAADDVRTCLTCHANPTKEVSR